MDYEKEFLDQFRKLTHTHASWDAWRDFVDLSAYTLANSIQAAIGQKDDIWDKREEAYKKISQQYTKDEMEVFNKMFCNVVLALEENSEQDFLGKIYMQLNINDGWKGQFFTPYHVSELMGTIVTGDGICVFTEEQDWVSVCDNACGAGCTLIAFANDCKKKGINYQQKVFFVAQDIDPTVAKMCYIQLALLGCPGYVIIGDSIADPPKGTVLNPIYDRERLFFLPMTYIYWQWQYRRNEDLARNNGIIREHINITTNQVYNGQNASVPITPILDEVTIKKIRGGFQQINKFFTERSKK